PHVLVRGVLLLRALGVGASLPRPQLGRRRGVVGAHRPAHELAGLRHLLLLGVGDTAHLPARGPVLRRVPASRIPVQPARLLPGVSLGRIRSPEPAGPRAALSAGDGIRLFHRVEALRRARVWPAPRRLRAALPLVRFLTLLLRLPPAERLLRQARPGRAALAAPLDRRVVPPPEPAPGSGDPGDVRGGGRAELVRYPRAPRGRRGRALRALRLLHRRRLPRVPLPRSAV